MTPPRRKQSRAGAWWQWATDRWNHTPGYLKWLGGILLGALVRLVFARLFPERWERLEHQLFDPTIPVWLAVVGLVAVLVLERIVPLLYRRLRAARTEGTRLRGTLWSGDASPTLWTCPSCGREFTTPEFPDITREAERRLGHARGEVSP